MPRRPDLPCAECGKLMHRTPSSLPEGQAMCHPCRRQRAGRLADQRLIDQTNRCLNCGGAIPVPPAYPGRLMCSDACGRARKAASMLRARAQRPEGLQPGPCSDCGETTSREANGFGRFCAGCSKRRASTRNARKSKGWSLKHLLPSVQAVAARDNHICHVCGGAVDMSLPFNDAMAPTRDHIIPRSAGGGHDPSNLKLAHRSCNSRRGAPLPG